MGMVFNIQKFCINDGPGIRTTVFFKGCPLRCAWCHNPESKATKPEIFYTPEKCIMCGACVDTCSKNAHSFCRETHIFDREKCINCGACTDVCAIEALEKTGYEISVDDVIAEVLKDKAFYESSGGGITLSGGEPMLQFEFAYEVLKTAKEKNLHTCMETCGFADFKNYAKIAELVDIFLFDYKITDRELHKQYTGVYNDKIIENLKMLDSIGCKTVLRCPVIPTINDKNEHFEGIAVMASSLKNIIEVNVEPYHPLGKGKSELLNKDYSLSEIEFSENETVEKWIEIISSLTSVPVKRA